MAAFPSVDLPHGITHQGLLDYIWPQGNAHNLRQSYLKKLTPGIQNEAKPCKGSASLTFDAYYLTGLLTEVDRQEASSQTHWARR